MSRELVGLMVFAPMSPNFVAARAALLEVEKATEKLRHDSVLSAKTIDELLVWDKALDVFKEFLSVDGECMHDWYEFDQALALVIDVKTSLDHAEKCWPPREVDCAYRVVPGTEDSSGKEQMLVIYAGDGTYGDTPSGPGYTMLLDLLALKAVSDALELR